jgi:hypothetical protein
MDVTGQNQDHCKDRFPEAIHTHRMVSIITQIKPQSYYLFCYALSAEVSTY